MREQSNTAAHPLDRAIAWWSRNSRMFARGWGDEAILDEATRRERYLATPLPITIRWSASGTLDAARRDGQFTSPLELLPAPVRTVALRRLSRPGNTIACVMPAASRDEGYRVREAVFGALVHGGLDLYLLENPYYGQRRITAGPSDLTVADHCLLALGMVLECRALLQSLRGHYAKLVVAGYSMAGHMAALAAAVSPFPVACAALATGASPAPIYTEGALSRSIDFSALGGEAACPRLREIFDRADITRFRRPLRPDAAVLAACTRDAYVSPREVERLQHHWTRSTLRWLDAGHFSALLTERRALRQAIVEAANRL